MDKEWEFNHLSVFVTLDCKRSVDVVSRLWVYVLRFPRSSSYFVFPSQVDELQLLYCFVNDYIMCASLQGNISASCDWFSFCLFASLFEFSLWFTKNTSKTFCQLADKIHFSRFLLRKAFTNALIGFVLTFVVTSRTSLWIFWVIIFVLVDS